MSTPHQRLVDGLTEQLVASVTGAQVPPSLVSLTHGQSHTIRFRRLLQNAQTRFKAALDPHPDPHTLRERFAGFSSPTTLLTIDW